MRKFIVGVVGFMLATSAMAGNFSVYYSSWDAGELGASAIGGGIRVDADLSDYVGAEIRLSFLNKFDEDPSDNATIVPIEVGLFGQLPLAHDHVILYGGGGLGYYMSPEFEDEFGDDIDVEDAIGYYVVAGARLMFSGSAGVFIEAKQTTLEPDEIEFPDYGVTVDLDGDLNGVMVNVGLALGW